MKEDNDMILRHKMMDPAARKESVMETEVKSLVMMAMQDKNMREEGAILKLKGKDEERVEKNQEMGDENAMKGEWKIMMTMEMITGINETRHSNWMKDKYDMSKEIREKKTEEMRKIKVMTESKEGKNQGTPAKIKDQEGNCQKWTEDIDKTLHHRVGLTRGERDMKVGVRKKLRQKLVRLS